MIFCLRQLQEKCIEQDRPLHMVFVDFSKEFDTVGRTGLWHLLRKCGCPEKFTTMIEVLHTGMMANVSVGGEVSELFSVTNGVKQGCVHPIDRPKLRCLVFHGSCIRTVSIWPSHYSSNSRYKDPIGPIHSG